MNGTVTISLREYEKLTEQFKKTQDHIGYVYSGYQIVFFKDQQECNKITSDIIQEQNKKIRALEMELIKERKIFGFF